MNIKYKLIFFLSIFILSINQVNADTSIYLECPKSTTIGSTINCDVSATSDIEISAITTKLDISDNLELISFTPDTSWQGNGNKGNIALYTYPNQKGTFKLGIASIKVLNSSNSSSITLKNTIFYNSNFKAINGNNASKNIKLLSTNNNLASLTINKETLTPKFDKNVLNYSLTTYNNSIIIVAKAEDESATVSGGGSRDLAYGNNNFTITVTSEAGTKKNYQITVTRNQKEEPIKKPAEEEKTNQPNKNDKTTNNNSKNNNNKNNPKIDTSKENTNKGNENNNNNQVNQSLKLKELTIEGYQIAFNEDNYTYKLELINNETKLNIKAIPLDDKVTVTITGNNNLKSGTNNIIVTLSSEDGNKLTYTIVATKANNICMLKDIKITGYKLNFACNKYKYNLKIKKENSLNIEVIPVDKNTKINIYNNNNLKNKDIITISVKNGDKNYNYKIKVLKEDKSLISIIILSLIVICSLGTIITIFLKKRKSNLK